ncbi:MAG: hypothetical protein JW896_08955 [Deltaproteobacteria bacterium]|nr:hypothetical protein [Deltaproteobacteria bacterium]
MTEIQAGMPALGGLVFLSMSLHKDFKRYYMSFRLPAPWNWGPLKGYIPLGCLPVLVEVTT